MLTLLAAEHTVDKTRFNMQMIADPVLFLLLMNRTIFMIVAQVAEKLASHTTDYRRIFKTTSGQH